MYVYLPISSFYAFFLLFRRLILTYDFEVHLITQFLISLRIIFRRRTYVRRTRICVVDNDLQGLLRKVVSTWSCRVFRVIDQSTRARQRRMEQFIISRGGGAIDRIPIDKFIWQAAATSSIKCTRDRWLLTVTIMTVLQIAYVTIVSEYITILKMNCQNCRLTKLSIHSFFYVNNIWY